MTRSDTFNNISMVHSKTRLLLKNSLGDEIFLTETCICQLLWVLFFFMYQNYLVGILMRVGT